MNILPVIFVFLTILALTSYSFIDQRAATATEMRSYLGYMRAERLSRNQAESRSFYKLGSKKESSSKNKTVDPKDTYLSQRCKTPPSEASRLSISLLFAANPPPLLYEAAAKLIKILYGNTPFFKDAKIIDLEYRILDLMIEKANKKEPASFTGLFPNDPFFQEIYYKMLKGTNRYSLDQKKGYPPLEDYFTLDNKKRKTPVQFPYASIQVLEALVDKKFADAVYQAEKKKWDKDGQQHTVTETEFNDLLLKKSKKGIQQTSIKELLDFSMKRPPTEQYRSTDKATSITTKKPS